ncbi:MAG: cyclic nucleotide-binding domain-containing protein [Spirochaetales bacterium]|nr:cyclic nucleotide-binding domain-containing protein [Spirochaetales bacterium]
MKRANRYPLKALGILSDLEAAELAELERMGELRLLRAGEVIMREGENASSMCILVEGEVEITRSLTLKTGRHDFGSAEKSMNRLRSDGGAVFGEMSMFADHPRSATVVARTDCAVRQVEREDFAAWCRERPESGIKVLSRIAAVLADRVRKGNDDVLKLSTALSIALAR